LYCVNCGVNWMLKKKWLRQSMLNKRDEIPKREREAKSLLIKEKLFDMLIFKDANLVGFYVSFRSEVETEAMIKESLRLDKRVVVPVSRAREKELQMVYIENFDEDLEVGTYGILEPKVAKSKQVDLDNLDIIILPGSVFDVSGYRLGYGGGYYDRFLQIIGSRAKTVGLAYEFQIVDEVPKEPHDIPVDWIVTEKRIIHCR